LKNAKVRNIAEIQVKNGGSALMENSTNSFLPLIKKTYSSCPYYIQDVNIP
jgi:hypothetical protein